MISRMAFNWSRDKFDTLYSMIKGVREGDIADDSVSAGMINYFLSTEQTGTGSAQNIAHGLGSTPTLVVVIPTVTAASGATTYAEGTHTSTNCVVTATTGAKYKVLAIK